MKLSAVLAPALLSLAVQTLNNIPPDSELCDSEICAHNGGDTIDDGTGNLNFGSHLMRLLTSFHIRTVPSLEQEARSLSLLQLVSPVIESM